MSWGNRLLATLAVPLLMLATAFNGVARADEVNSIESLTVARQGAEIIMKITTHEPLTSPPAGFSIASPARIAFDFTKVGNGLGHSSQTVNEGDLTSVNVVQVGDRTRLVLNLLKNMNYSTRIDGNALLVILSPLSPTDGTPAAGVTRFVEESKVGAKHEIRNVGFRRGTDGEGRITVDLSDSGTGIDIRQQGKSLVVDFLKTSLPSSLNRKLDVTDFATPVTTVVTQEMGENVRMTITPTGQWEHNAYQADNQFVVEVKKIIEDPNKLVQGSKIGYKGPRVSINYQNGEVRALLRLMAEELGLNAVISETVTGTTTLVLKDVPADQVIDIIFQQKGLDMRKNGNVVLIAPRDEIATREKLQYETEQNKIDLEPLRTERFVLSYQKAADMQALLTNADQKIVSKRGSVVVDAYTNSIFVKDIPAVLETVKQLIAQIDVRTKQVLIEARIVEATDTFSKDLGVKLGLLNSSSTRIGNSGISIGGGSYSTTGQSDTSTGTVNLAASSATSTLSFSLFNSSLSKILNVELSALESDGMGKIISSPRVVTGDNVKASIEDGYEIPYTTTTSTTTGTSTTVSFKKAKLALETTPQITPDGNIRMKVAVTKESPDWTTMPSGTTNPPIKSTKLETDVTVENGGTLVIGGVFTSDISSTVDKVPVLGDIPVLGVLFKSTSKSSDRRELLIFITPRVVSDALRFQ
jgi:type IV pilus assembly protein PilQ